MKPTAIIFYLESNDHITMRVWFDDAFYQDSNFMGWRHAFKAAEYVFNISAPIHIRVNQVMSRSDYLDARGI